MVYVFRNSPAFRIPKLLSFLFEFICICGLISCGDSTHLNTDQAVAKKILLLGNGAEPKALDPHIATGMNAQYIISSMLEGLVSVHPTDDSKVMPGIAERWETNENASQWTFYLRKNAFWSNGDPVVADDFRYSFQRILSPELASDYGELLYVLKNAEAFHRGKINDFSQVGVKVIDEYTLVLDLVGPTPYFLTMLTHYAWAPVNPRVIESYGGMTARNMDWTREDYVCNGPFILEKWAPYRILKVKKNPTYWDAANVKLNGIHFFPIESSETEERAFWGKQLHMTSQMATDKIPTYRHKYPDILKTSPFLGTYYYILNVIDEGPLQDVRVRRALSLAIDRKQLTEKITLGGQDPAKGFTPTGIGDYQPPALVCYDLAQARRLMAEAGYPEGHGFPVLELKYNTSEGHRKVAQAIQQMWQKNLGIKVSLANEEWKVFLDSTRNHHFDIARSGWIGDFMDPLTFLMIFTTGNAHNNAGWSNPDYDELIQKAYRTPTLEAHYAVLQQAERLLLEEMPIIPIYYYTQTCLMDPRVKNMRPKLLGMRAYKYIDLQEGKEE